MRVTYSSVFATTLITDRVFSAIFVDHDLYVLRGDGTKVIKDRAGVPQRVFGGLILALPFALVETGLLWSWQKLRRPPTAQD